MTTARTHTHEMLLRPPDRHGYRRVSIAGVRYRVTVEHHGLNFASTAVVEARVEDTEARYRQLDSTITRPQAHDGSSVLPDAADLIDQHSAAYVAALRS